MEKIENPWVGLKDYQCFGCAPDNARGLRMTFYEDGDDIVATWKPEDYYQGWLDTLHGGIQSTLMDELAGWVVFRKLQTAGVTSRLDARFLKSVSTKEPWLTIRGRIKDRKRSAVFIETEIRDSRDELCARADIVYFAMPRERAEKEFFFKGCELEKKE